MPASANMNETNDRVSAVAANRTELLENRVRALSREIDRTIVEERLLIGGIETRGAYKAMQQSGYLVKVGTQTDETEGRMQRETGRESVSLSKTRAAAPGIRANVKMQQGTSRKKSLEKIFRAFGACTKET